ncbi:MAG: hypothetical protein ACI9XC_000313 [Gammaproteobacteria bacterium]|jgi:hypothetical protein
MRNDVLRYLGQRPIPITPNRLATSQFSGEWTSPYSGKGMDFRSHRAYELGDDPRSINMSMSLRSGKRMVVERIATRDISIFVLIDCSASMGIRRKADILLATSLMLLYSGVKMEMRVGAALLTDQGFHGLGIGMGYRHASRLFDQVEQACTSVSIGSTLPVKFSSYGLSRLVPTGCILLYVSDFLNQQGFPQSSLPLSLNVNRYDYIPVVVQDEFEFSFPDMTDSTMIELIDPETNSVRPVWFGKSERKLIKTLHQKRFAEINDSFSDRGLNFVHISEPEIEKAHHSLSSFFIYR